MSGNIHVVTILTPKPGKIDEIVEKIAPYNAFVKANEPGTLQYEIFRQINGETEVLVYLQVFKDKASLEAHGSSSEYTEMLKKAAEEDLLLSLPDTKVLTHVAGFPLRG